VQRVAAAIVVLLVASGCAHARPYAGLTRQEARRESVDAARALPNVEALTNDFASPMTARPTVTLRARNSAGDEAWLTIFRLFKHQVGDPDQACVWVWRSGGTLRFEDVPSTAYGHVPDALHDRCVNVVLARGLASPDQVMGSEMPSPTIARPPLVTPFGPLARGVTPTDVLPADAFFEIGPSVAGPGAVARGACGYAGIVSNADATKTVPFARIALTPSRPWSGISDGGAFAWPTGAVETIADHWGAFVFTNLPYTPQGYDVSIRARDYAPSRVVHEQCFEGDLAVGEWVVDSSPTFVDGTPYPVGAG
jgi:hypothetical protein